MEQKNQKLVCSLSFDEMSIRKHFQWCTKTKTFLGNVTYGGKRGELANNAIVFLANGLNEKVQVPVAYHFITTLNAKDRICLVLEVLAEISKQGVIVSNICFDGLSANKSMCELLGASFKIGEMQTYFIVPYSKRKIYIILDPSHCIKLIRNNLCNRRVLIDVYNLKKFILTSYLKIRF